MNYSLKVIATKSITRIIPILLFSFFTLHSYSQTNIPSGFVSGTWKKANSPYKINGQIYVPKDSTLRIESGVKVEFQGAYMLHVYGSLQALGKVADSVLFTPSNKTTGWQGIHVHGNTNPKDSFIMEYFRIEYVNFRNLTTKTHGAIGLDTCNKVRISNGLFYKNSSNVGGGVRIMRSKVIIYTSSFIGNRAEDFGTTSTVASGSAIYASSSDINLSNVQFIGNQCTIPNNKAQDSINGYAKGTIYLATNGITGNYNLNSSFFYSNYATSNAGVYASGSNTLNINLDGLKFENNYCVWGSVIKLNQSSGVVSIKNTIFNNNNPRRFYTMAEGTAIVSNKDITPVLENCIVSYQHYSAIDLFGGRINKLKLFACNGQGLNSTAGLMRVDNSLIFNNGSGVLTFAGAKLLISNSAIVYNGSSFFEKDSIRGGIYMASSSTASSYSVVNSIISHNRNGNLFNNLIGAQGGTTITNIVNSIIEGGIDSLKFFTGNAYQLNKVSVTNAQNLINDTVRFTKPPVKIGKNGFDKNCDFHPINSCIYLPTSLNSGINNFTDILTGFSLSLSNTTDLDGNPRIRCGTVDIGPYELEGSKQSVSIDSEPTDQAICPKTTAIIAPTACGASLSYQWQQSSNGTTFSNISGANAASYSLQPTDSGYYRLIITQAECNKKDTSRAAKIAFKAGGKMSLVANAKDSTLCSKQPIVLQATLNNANSYQWQESNDGTAFSNISGATSNPYNTIANSTQWYRLIAKNTLCNYSDTFPAAKVTTNPLPTPNLGADASIPNGGSKVLNPGTFNAYAWSTGATTPALTVDKNNLTTGANAISVQVTGANGCKASDTVVITLEPANGLQDPSVAGIRIYPNPTSDLLTIAIPESASTAGVYHLSTIDGRILQTGNLQPQLQLNLSNLTAGTYFLSLDIDGVRYGVKVVK